MSTILSAPPAAQCVARQSQVDRLVARLKRWWVTYIAWRIQQGAIAQLKSMNDRELKDIGLSRSQIECAVMGERARDHVFSRYYYSAKKAQSHEHQFCVPPTERQVRPGDRPALLRRRL